MYKIIYFLIVIFVLFTTNNGFAQNSNSLSVTDRNPVALNMSTLTSAGMNNEIILDNSQWMNYAVETNPSEPYTSISVAITAGSVPPGIEIYLEAGFNHGSGYGKTGRPTGKIHLNNSPKVLINEIGSSNTGRGKHRGHRLTMSMVITDFSLLQPGDYSLYILYTLAQQ